MSSRYFANYEIRTDREICVLTVKMSQPDIFSISYLTDNSPSAVYSPETSWLKQKEVDTDPFGFSSSPIHCP